MRPVDEFLELYNTLHQFLRSSGNNRIDESFVDGLNRVSGNNPSVKHQRQFLYNLHELRNIIVHYKQYPRTIIAEPNEAVVREFRRVLDNLKSPEVVIPRFQREIRVFEARDPLNQVLKYLGENDYSQAVVLIDSMYRILSAEGIAKWLGSSCPIGIADIDGASVSDAHDYEDLHSVAYIARNGTVDGASEKFGDAINNGIPRLHAIIISNSGRPTEKPIGIITPWDLVGARGDSDQ